MRIAMVGHKRVPSREGGIEVVVEELAARMVMHGHSVTCYNRTGHHVSGKEYDIEHLDEYRGIRLKRVPTIDRKDRVANHAAMREIICAWTKDYTIDEIDKMLNDAGCPACPVNTIDRLVTDPQIAGAREMFPEIDQPGIGKLKITAVPQHLTRTKAYPRKAAPLLGEDNAKIYGELLGLDAAKLEELKAKGAI